MEEIRSIQMTGGSTFTVSLPKDWAQKAGIDKGSRVVLSEKDDGSISIYPLERKKSDQRVKEIDLGDPSLTTREVIAAYIMGFDTIILRSDHMDSRKRSEVFDLVEGLMGLEVVREDTRSIEIRQMIDPTQLTVPSALSRLALLAESMVQDLPEAMGNSDLRVLGDISAREPHIDRIHWFLVRQINYGIMDHRFSHTVDLDIRLATCYLSVSRNIERICDHIENVCRMIQESQGELAVPSSLIELADLCSRIFSQSIRSFIRDQLPDAQEVLVEVDHHRKDYAALTFDDLSKETQGDEGTKFMLIAESLHRIISYSQDIAEIAVDRNLSA